MFRISDTVIYCGTQLCVIADIRDESFGGVKKPYYILKPVYDKNSTLYHPVDLANGKIRLPVSEQEAKKLVENKTAAELEWVSSDPLRKEHFSLLLKESDPGILVAMIRLIHSKRTELAQNGKRLRAADEKAFSEAKKAVCEELSFALGTDRENVIDMILGN